MKLLYDQNLPRSLVWRLSEVYPQSAHVADVGLAQESDQTIWEFARDHDFTIVSKDSDFRQLAFVYGPPPKVVWLRVGNVSTNEVEVLLRSVVARLDEFDSTAEESFLVLSRRP